VEQRTAEVPSDDGMPVVADGESVEVSTHCNHQALQHMKNNKVHSQGNQEERSSSPAPVAIISRTRLKKNTPGETQRIFWQ
jgi:hypothetical protein